MDQNQRYYQVGRRPLDGFGWAYNTPKLGSVGGDHNLRWEHQQLFANDGQNSGASKEGMLTNEHQRINEYAFDIPGIGSRRMKAQYIEPAIEKVNNDRELVVEQVQAMGYPFETAYSFLANNCQHYADDVLKEAERLAKQNNDSLYLD